MHAHCVELPLPFLTQLIFLKECTKIILTQFISVSSLIMVCNLSYQLKMNNRRDCHLISISCFPFNNFSRASVSTLQATLI